MYSVCTKNKISVLQIPTKLEHFFMRNTKVSPCCCLSSLRCADSELQKAVIEGGSRRSVEFSALHLFKSWMSGFLPVLQSGIIVS